MKKLNIAFVALLLCISCSKEDQFKGSGNIVSENREVVTFTRVDSSSSINVIISQGNIQDVQVASDDNIINEVKTIVENGILKIGLGAGNYIDVTITVSITIPNLEGIENIGSGNITISNFEAVANLDINNTGSGTIVLSGSSTALTINNSGSGAYRGFDFSVENGMVINTGSGDCEISATESLTGSNSGSGSVFYKGSATIDITNTGSGQVVNSN